MYKDMSLILKDGQVGDFELQHFNISDNNFYAIVRLGIPPGRYIRLINGCDCVMSDTPMEKETNRDFVHNAHGNVLIGGLGIGLIILAIQNKEDVYNKQMKPLINRYRKYLVPKAEDENRYIDCWCKRQAKNGERI
jgi:hypothetical protein|nr:MAG TPA: hypothetical protein [Bacteriophage sp.]DAW88763.1 MAG TPA: hypothetical protein [Bacteriophage sp.]